MSILFLILAMMLAGLQGGCDAGRGILPLHTAARTQGSAHTSASVLWSLSLQDDADFSQSMPSCRPQQSCSARFLAFG